MALRKILSHLNPALHKKCKPVESFDNKLHTLLDDMRDTLIESGGVGLAAPQVGILRRVVLVDNGEEIWNSSIPPSSQPTVSRRVLRAA